MKAVIVCPGWPGLANPSNGVFVRNQALDLMATGCQVTAVTGRTYKIDPLLVDDAGVAVHRFRWPSDNRLLAEYTSIPAARVICYLASGLFKTWQIVSRTRPDVIQAHFVIPSGLIAVVVGRLTHCPVVVTAHDSDVTTFPNRSRIAAFLIAWTLRHATRIVPTTRQLAEHIAERFGIESDMISVIPLGIDTTAFVQGSSEAARKALKLPSDRPIILFVGAFLAVKGVDVLAGVVGQVVARKPDALFVLVGDGPLRSSIETEIKAEGLSTHVVFAGARPHEELPAWYNASDVLAMPMPLGCHGQGMAIVEATAAGLPVVATDTAGIPDSVNEGKNGFLINPNDREILVDRIIRSLEPNAWPAIDEEVARVRERIDHRAVADKVVALYQSLI